jgi:hypothetical protein
MGEARTLFLGLSTKQGLNWNEAKGRVVDGTLFVETPQGEQGMPLSNSTVNTFDNIDSNGPKFCFSLQLGQGSSLPMGVADAESRDIWIKMIKEGIQAGGGGDDDGNGRAKNTMEFEIMEDSSDEEEEEMKGGEVGEEKIGVIQNSNQGSGTNKNKSMSKPTQLEEDEAGVIGVVCEGVELAIEREAQTEDDAIAILRQHLGTNEESLERAIALWCKRFDVDMPEEFTPGDDAVSVIAKWMFWVIQSRTLLRARFSPISSSVQKGSSGQIKKDDPLQDLVLGEWAGELELTLNDIDLLYSDEQLRDDVTRDLAFWFANKAQQEKIHALDARGGGGTRASEEELRSSTVIRRSKYDNDDVGYQEKGFNLNNELAELVKKKKKEESSRREKNGKDVSSQESSATAHVMRAAMTHSNNNINDMFNKEENDETGGLVGFDEMSSDQRLKAFKLLSSDEKAEVLIDLTPMERAPLIESLTLPQIVELIAMEDVVMALSATELSKVGETSLNDRALALTRLGRAAKFKLFALEGRNEAMEIEQLRRATLTTYDPNPSPAAIEVAVAARVNLYHLLDHKSRIEVMSSFIDRRERTDLLKALRPEDRQDFIDACITAEMGGNREWFNGWDWFDWFDFDLAAYDNEAIGTDGGQSSSTSQPPSSVMSAYMELIADEDRIEDEEAVKKLNREKAQLNHDLNSGVPPSSSSSSEFNAASSYGQGLMQEFASLGNNAFTQLNSTAVGGLSRSRGEHDDQGGITGNANIPMSTRAEADRLALRDVRLRDLEEDIRKVVNGDGILRGLLDDWRGHKGKELEAMAQLAAIKRQQAGAQQNEANEKALAASAGAGKGAADRLDAAREASGEEASVRAASSLEMELEQSRRLAQGVEEAMALARKSLLPSAIDRTDVALLAQRVSISYLTEIELMKNNLANENKLNAKKSSINESQEDIDENDMEDLKLKVFTLELENARLASEMAHAHKLLVEQTSSTEGMGGSGGKIDLNSTSKGEPGSEIERLKKELVATRTRVSLLSQDTAKARSEAREMEARAKAAEDDAAKRKLDSSDIGNRFAALKALHDTSAGEVAFLKQLLEGTIASKDQAEAKVTVLESRLATIAQLDPHRWHAGRQNVRLENELRAAREERDRAVARMTKDVAHFKAEMSLAADKLERSEAHLLSTLQAAKEAAALAEAEQSDLVKRNLAIQALLTTANTRVDEQSQAFDELRMSYLELEKVGKENSAKIALYERRCSIAEESLADARTRLVSLTKTHELMKASETRRVLAYNKEKANLEEIRDGLMKKVEMLTNALTESRHAGQEVAKGLEMSKEKIKLLEEDTASLLDQEAELRAALSETKGVLLTITSDYRERMAEAAVVARNLRAKETELAQKTLELRTALVASDSLKDQLDAASSKAELSSSRVVLLQRRLANQGAEVDQAADNLMKISLTLEPTIASKAQLSDSDTSEDALQMNRLAEMQRAIAALTSSISASNAANAGEMEEDLKAANSGSTNKSDAINSQLNDARRTAEQLEGLAAMHAEKEDGSSFMFTDTVLMSETERILSLIDSVESTRPVSVSLNRPPDSLPEEEDESAPAPESSAAPQDGGEEESAPAPESSSAPQDGEEELPPQDEKEEEGAE